MDNLFSSNYNAQARQYAGEKDDFVSKMNIARNNTVYNAYNRIKGEPQEYKNFYVEYQKAKYIHDNAGYIYQTAEDPREAANAHNLGVIINKLYPSIPVDVAEKQYKPIIKSVIGDEMDATTLLGVAGKTFSNTFNNLLLGANVYTHANMKVFDGSPEEVQKKRDAEYKARVEEIKKAKGLNQRTDYYNKQFNSLIDQMVISAAEIIPSEIFSLGPEILGAALSAFTKLPVFYTTGKAISKASAAFMEAGGSALELYEAGADWDTIRAFSNVVGLVNGALEIVGNIPEAKVNEALFGMKAVRKGIDDTNVTHGLVSEVFKKMAVNYTMGLIIEPGTEALQELVSMYAMNLASKWEEQHKGRSFQEEFTYTPQEMAEAMKEVALSTLKGQVLLGLSSNAFSFYQNMRKGGQFLYNEKTNTGFKWDTGELRRILDARKFGAYNTDSILVNNDMVNTGSKSNGEYDPGAVDEKGRPLVGVQPVQAWKINNEYVPINKQERAKADYFKNNTKSAMYIDVVDQKKSDVTDTVSKADINTIVNSLPDEYNGHKIEYSVDEGKVIVPEADFNYVVDDFITANASQIDNIYQEKDGVTVTIGDKNVTITTNTTETAEVFSQDQYVADLKSKMDTEEEKEALDEKLKLQKRVDELQKKFGNLNLKRNVKSRQFNKAVDEIVSKIADPEKRAEVKKMYTDEVARQQKTIKQAYEEAGKDSKLAKVLKGRNIDDMTLSIARATVLVEGKLAESMGKTLGEFANKLNISFNPEYEQEGKTRMGWTDANADGTYTINLTKFADQTTAIHEIGHAYLWMLGKDNYDKIEGFKEAFAEELAIEDEDKRDDAVHEAFAKALEDYVNQGVAKSEGLKKVFDTIIEALRNFVDAVRNFITPEQAKMFDTLFDKGLMEGWTEQDTVNVGTKYKTASDYYTDYQINSKNRTPEGNRNDRIVTDGFMSTIKQTYGDYVDVKYQRDGKIKIDVKSEDALRDISNFLSETESKELTRAVHTASMSEYAMFLPHGNIQLIDVYDKTNGNTDIVPHISDVVMSERDTGFVFKYYGDEGNTSLVDVYNQYVDEETRDNTILFHASKALFDRFKTSIKAALGRKWGNGSYFFGNKKATSRVLDGLLQNSNQQTGYIYTSKVRTGNESAFIHANGVDSTVTEDQIDLLDSYIHDEIGIGGIDELCQRFIQWMPVPSNEFANETEQKMRETFAEEGMDYDEYRKATGFNLYGKNYDEITQQLKEYFWSGDIDEMIEIADGAARAILAGEEPSGEGFLYLMWYMFGKDDAMQDAIDVLHDVGFKGLIVHNDYWLGEDQTSEDEDTGNVVYPTEVIVFDPSDIEITDVKEMNRADAYNEGYATGSWASQNERVFKKQVKYKTLWTDDEITKTLADGKFVPTAELNSHSDLGAVKIERIAQNIVAAHEDIYNAGKKAIDDYIVNSGKTTDKFTAKDWENVLELWKKNIKTDKNPLKELPKNNDSILLLKRINAYANDETPERTTTQFLDSLDHTKNYRDTIQNLVSKMEQAGLFKNKKKVGNATLSSKYPYLNYIYDKLQKAKDKGTRSYIDDSVYMFAREEARKNVREILNAIDQQSTAKGDIMQEINSDEDYTESSSIKELLNLDLTDEVKDVINEGRWNGTTAKRLAKKYDEIIKKKGLQDTTISDLRKLRDSLKDKNKRLSERVEELKKSERENTDKIATLEKQQAANERKITKLNNDIADLSSRYAARKMELALLRGKNDLLKTAKSKGNALMDRAINDVVKTLIGNVTEEISVPNNVLALIPCTKEFLESEGFLKDNKLTGGIKDMTPQQIMGLRKAVKADKDMSRGTEQLRKSEFESKVQKDVSKIIGSMENKKLGKLTKDDEDKIENLKERRVENFKETYKTDPTAEQLNEIDENARRDYLKYKVDSIMRNARYGANEHIDKNRRNRSVGDDFTTFSRILRHVSPELYKIVMEDGLNVVTDAKLRNSEERIKRGMDNLMKLTGSKNEKQLRKNLAFLVNEKYELKRIDKDAPIDSRLVKSKEFKRILEDELKRGYKKSDVKYTLQELMAIYEHSFNDGSLKHLYEGNHIQASEIAWVVDQFENGELKKYKPIADELRRIMEEKFEDIYNKVLKVENREVQKVDFYSPQLNIDFDTDLGLNFGYIFDDKKEHLKDTFTKTRQYGSNAISLNYYTNLMRVIEMQEGYLAGAEFFKEMDHLFSSEGGNLRNIITEFYGEDTSRRIMTMLDLTKNESKRMGLQTELDGWVSTIRNHYVMARLAYNMSSVLQQPASWFLGLSKYGPIKLMKATMQFMAHPIQMTKMVYELSPQMKRNVNPLLSMARETMSQNPTTLAGKANNVISSIGNKGLDLMEKVDHITRNILWWTAYQAELDSLSNGDGVSEADADLAQRRATQWVMDIQSSTQVKDNSLAYSGYNQLFKNLLMFTNQLNKEWNMLWNDAIKDGLLDKQFAKFGANFAALALSTMWIVFATGRFKNDEDDDETWIEDLSGDWATEFVSRVPILGQTAKNALEGFSYEQSDDPITRTIELIAKLAKFAEADTPKNKKKAGTAIRNEVWSLADILGLPTTMLKRGYQSFEGGDFLQADHFLRQLGGEWYKYFEE